jgi:hypothetical protein
MQDLVIKNGYGDLKTAETVLNFKQYICVPGLSRG